MTAAFQDSGFAFQGTGQFAFQTSLGTGGGGLPKSKRKRYRNIYRIKVDGEAFEFSTYQAALDFLDQAKRAAAELADKTLLEAIEARRQEPVEIPLPTLKGPEIVVSSRDLRAAVADTKREIEQIYSKAKRNAEIALWLDVVKRDQDNEDIIWFM